MQKIEYQGMKIYNSTQKNIISDDANVAQTFWTRSVGLLSRNALSKHEALIIKPCCSIHTFFMKFSIDVLFVNSKNEIVALYEDVKPWRILPIHLLSKYVVELCAGQVLAKNIKKGDIIQINE